jgi:hypothetical protein
MRKAAAARLPAEALTEELKSRKERRYFTASRLLGMPIPV